MTNSPLVVIDEHGQSHPLLAQELPSRDPGTWVVNADGTMRTTWKLRPNTRWHDGRPVRYADFLFAFTAYMDDRVTVRDRLPEQFIDRVVVTDDQTFDILWKQTYPFAADLFQRRLEPLPEHILGPLYVAGDPVAFQSDSFWSSENYVGTGPYRVAQWDRGNQIVFRAFPDYVQGKAKIDEVILRIIGDANTVVANVLSDTVDVSVGEQTLSVEGGATIRDQWAKNGGGTVVVIPTLFRFEQIQFDPTRNQQPALFDQRVRRALAHAVDRATLADSVSLGFSPPVDVPLAPTEPPWFHSIDHRLTERDGDRLGAGLRLELREDVAHVALHRLG